VYWSCDLVFAVIISSTQPCTFVGVDRCHDACLSEHPVPCSRVTEGRCWLIGLLLECCKVWGFPNWYDFAVMGLYGYWVPCGTKFSITPELRGRRAIPCYEPIHLCRVVASLKTSRHQKTVFAGKKCLVGKECYHNSMDFPPIQPELSLSTRVRICKDEWISGSLCKGT
jgi:hypothetical protein